MVRKWKVVVGGTCHKLGKLKTLDHLIRLITSEFSELCYGHTSLKITIRFYCKNTLFFYKIIFPTCKSCLCNRGNCVGPIRWSYKIYRDDCQLFSTWCGTIFFIECGITKVNSLTDEKRASWNAPYLFSVVDALWYSTHTIHMGVERLPIRQIKPTQPHYARGGAHWAINGSGAKVLR